MTGITYPNKAAALRAKLLGENVPPAKTITIGDEVFFIRTPLVSDRQKMTDMAGLNVAPQKQRGKMPRPPTADELKVDGAALQAAATVLLAVDEVGNPIFTTVDIPTLRDVAQGSTVARLGEACMRVMMGKSPEKPADEEDDVNEGEG